jgi:protoheme IX farnesyltransferase
VVAVERPSLGNLDGLISFLGQKLGDYFILAKARLSVMVLATGLVGYWLASGQAPNLAGLAWFGAGCFLVIAGANAFNQVIERSLDGMMQRTASRPLPAGRMSVGEAMAVSTLMSAGGLGILLWSTNWLASALAVLAWVVYLTVYTPLKRVTHWSTMAGAVSGAIPPLMGWSAVGGELPPAAWALFGILFLWQFPHTYSIAAAYREDFTRAGYQVLPLVDEKGHRTRGQVIAFTLALAVVSLLPAYYGVAGSIYMVGAALGSLVFVGCAIRFGAGRRRRLAGQLMAASLIYMPLILALLLLDRRSI